MAAGDVLWNTSLDGSDVTGAVSIFLNDDIFVVTEQQELFRVDVDGNVIWQNSAGGGTGDVNAGGVLLEDGTYVTGTSHDSEPIRGYDFDDGSEVFRVSLPLQDKCEDSAPVLLSDGTMVIGGNDGIYHFDPSDGTLLDSRTNGDTNDSSPVALYGSDGIINQFTGASEVRSYDASLNLNWATGVGDGGNTMHASVDQDLNTYMPDEAGNLYKIDSGGSIVWTASIPSVDGRNASTAVHDSANRVYAYTNDESTAHLTTFTMGGDELWQVSDSSVGSGASHIQAIPLLDETFIISWNGGISKFDKGGTELWHTDAGGGFCHSSPAASDTGFVAVGGSDGNLYKIELENQPVYTLDDANARPWDASKFRHNSGQFAASNQALLFQEGELGLRGGSVNPGDQAVLYKEELARGEQDENAGQDVLLPREDLGQG